MGGDKREECRGGKGVEDRRGQRKGGEEEESGHERGGGIGVEGK